MSNRIAIFPAEFISDAQPGDWIEINGKARMVDSVDGKAIRLTDGTRVGYTR